VWVRARVIVRGGEGEGAGALSAASSLEGPMLKRLRCGTRRQPATGTACQRAPRYPLVLGLPSEQPPWLIPRSRPRDARRTLGWELTRSSGARAQAGAEGLAGAGQRNQVEGTEAEVSVPGQSATAP